MVNCELEHGGYLQRTEISGVVCPSSDKRPYFRMPTYIVLFMPIAEVSLLLCSCYHLVLLQTTITNHLPLICVPCLIHFCLVAAQGLSSRHGVYK